MAIHGLWIGDDPKFTTSTGMILQERTQFQVEKLLHAPKNWTHPLKKWMGWKKIQSDLLN